MRLAGDSYARAAALDPRCAPAFAGMALVAARTGEASARSLAERALALDPRDVTAISALAALDLEAGAPDRAAAAARGLLARSNLSAAERIAALTLLGDALASPAEAFAAYAAAQALAAAVHAPRFGTGRSGRSHRELVEWLTASVERVAALPASTPVSGEASSHVFLLGYPRSGTTLVENVLASAPGVEALEERPTLAEADRAFLADDVGLARLAALDAAQAVPFREAYWRKVAAAGIDVAGKVFVDMDPLKGIKLPVIARLFPGTKIVVVRRDPRDVVWSCFRRNFRIGAATYEFTSLEGTARHYDAVMRLTERCLAAYPLEVHEVRYDALVGDFDTTTGALCRAIGVPWSAAMRDFAGTARRRGVATASATQVRRALYDGGGQWRRYATQLEPVLPLLSPWVERFGFAP